MISEGKRRRRRIILVYFVENVYFVGREKLRRRWNNTNNIMFCN